MVKEKLSNLKILGMKNVIIVLGIFSFSLLGVLVPLNFFLPAKIWFLMTGTFLFGLFIGLIIASSYKDKLEKLKEQYNRDLEITYEHGDE